MKSNSQKIVILALIATAVMASSLAMAAANINKVAGSKHDFSKTGTGSTKAPDGTLGNQVCIYCHTPHNAGQTRLLWNKAGNGNTVFKLYTSSDTLSPSAKASLKLGLDANSPSLLCLTCHDGKTAMNVLHSGGQGSLASAAGPPLVGYPADAKLAYGSAPIVMPGYMLGDPNLVAVGYNEDLTNDHPIGFSYTAAQGEKPTALNAIGSAALDPRIKFSGTAKKVECSSCHDPHVDATDTARDKFLVMSNSGSALCLACHIK